MSGILSAICTNYAIASAFPSTVKVLVVGGGGGGGSGSGGGGGAGGLVYDSAYSISNNSAYSVTVGTGGPGMISGNPAVVNGGNSLFGNLIGYGGGGGVNGAENGRNGGCGGGASNPGYTAGLGSQGGNGGIYENDSYHGGGGGGGGMGGNGQNGNISSNSSGGNGGIGVQNDISGSNTYYAGGGAGGPDNYRGGSFATGGLGGGGSGDGGNGTNGLGGGGAGHGNNPHGNGGNGGSGVVIISYVGSPIATGGTITSSGGNTIHTFTSSGSFVVGTPPVTYATWNPADKSTGITLSNGNLTIDGTLYQWCNVRSTISKTSGKWYWETHIDASDNMGRINNGIGNNSTALDTYYLGYDANSWGFITPQKIHQNAFTNYSTALSVGDTLGIALDMDNLTISYLINNVSQGVAFTVDSGNIFAMSGMFYSGATTTTNFGATPFTYTPPVGFNAGLYE